MSKSGNMLRTRRRDNNVKPNRRLDRKSSRGMIYENEELRLKTININAEVERGQSDIKKLKRENEMLKKEIWCLRDEYDKLDKLLKDKRIDFSSASTTCSSDSESSSSCTEESEEVETSQNLQNVQKTNMENIHREFDHLSVVPEENSTEASDKTSNRASIPNDQWNFEKDIIKPDQSYPSYQNSNRAPMNFFSPIKINNCFNQERNDILYPGEFYGTPLNYQRNVECSNCLSDNTNSSSFYQNMVLVPNSNQISQNLEKTTTDLLVKINNCNFDNRHLVFSNTPSQSTFSNGGNLEELLNDIEQISQDILKISNLQRPYANFNGTELQQQYPENPVLDTENQQDLLGQKPYKTELNVVLMPNPMPLIGFDKYQNIQRSFESINSKILDEMSASQQNLCLLTPGDTPQDQTFHQPFQESTTPAITVTNPEPVETNPFFFGKLTDNYVNSDYFNVRYNPENFNSGSDADKKKETVVTIDPKATSKTNLLEVPSSDHISSENEENLKFKTTKFETPKSEDKPPPTTSDSDKPKSPKLSIRRKVSIHFKGKKDKTKKMSLDSSELYKTKLPTDKKHSLFDIKFSSDVGKDKHKTLTKTPSVESKKSTTETSNADGKTPTSSDSKTSNCEKKNSIIVTKTEGGEKKPRKSVSVSPDRNKHVHVKEDGGPKKHKKHKKLDRARNRRSTINSIDARNIRERSYSVCTNRSNILEHRLGLGLGVGSSYLYDDYSDRERTNSLSSCDTVNTHRKLSGISNVPVGKVPWCGCWGNGCL